MGAQGRQPWPRIFVATVAGLAAAGIALLLVRSEVHWGGSSPAAPQLTRIIEFAGRHWFVRSGYGGPGPNYWSDSDQSVWVDGSGQLHLRLRNIGGTWYSAEVYSVEPTSYGMHRFFVDSALDALNQNVVLGLFLYQDDQHELDIEFSRWGTPMNPNNAQYVVQPSSNAGNLERFAMKLNGTYTTHYLDWWPSYVRFKSIHGHYPEPPDSGYLIHEWLSTSADIPPEEGNLRIQMNLWLVNGNPPSDGKEVEVVLDSADLPLPTFTPTPTPSNGDGWASFVAVLGGLAVTAAALGPLVWYARRRWLK